MQKIAIFSVLIFLTACGVSRQEVVSRLGGQYVGQSVDIMVARFGPPSNSFRLTSGGMSYEWQLTAETDTDYTVGQTYASGTSQTSFCKIRVMTAPNGIVSGLSTEDAGGTGGLVGAVTGVNVVSRSLCARHLNMQKDG